MKFIWLLSLLLFTGCFGGEKKHSLNVNKMAILNPDVFLKLNDDMPEDFKTSGKYTHPHGKIMTGLAKQQGFSFVAPKEAPRLIRVMFPKLNQPQQGVSGLSYADNGDLYFITDNGYGTKFNSQDYPLYFAKMNFQWNGLVAYGEEFYYLRDPNKVLKFPIKYQDTEERYLTGGDLDPESIQIVGDKVYIGDEFGPYIIETTLQGVVLNYYPLKIDGKEYRSPDNPDGFNLDEWHVKRSGGFEGLALSTDKTHLFAMLEAPLEKGSEKEGGEENPFVRVFKFDLSSKKFVSQYKYPLTDDDYAIGEFIIAPNGEGLVIERDWGEGDPKFACKERVFDRCYDIPARFKRVYKVSFPWLFGNTLKKSDYIDLMDLKTDNKKVVERLKGRINMPFVTIEGLAINNNELIVVNDNNYGFSAGRQFDLNDNTEFFFLDIKDFF